MSELEEQIKELKKSRKKLYVATSANLIFGISLLILFIASITNIYIFRNLHFILKLSWLVAAIINFYSIFKTIPTLKRSKKIISKAEELHLVGT